MKMPFYILWEIMIHPDYDAKQQLVDSWLKQTIESVSSDLLKGEERISFTGHVYG